MTSTMKHVHVHFWLPTSGFRLLVNFLEEESIYPDLFKLIIRIKCRKVHQLDFGRIQGIFA